METEAEPCNVCGGTDSKLIDGFYYCVECGTQNTNVRETVIEEKTLGDGTFAQSSRRKIIQIKHEGIEMSGEWYKWHAFNFIIYGLAEDLISLGAKPSFKLKLLWIWTRYIKTYQNKSELMMNKTTYDSKNETGFPSFIFEEESIQEEDIVEQDTTSNKKINKCDITNGSPRDIKFLSIGVIIAMLYLALNLDESEIQLCDLYRFIKNKELDISNPKRFVPQEINVKKIPVWLNFVRSKLCTQHQLRALAMSLLKKLDLGTPKVPDLKKLVDNYLTELCLPNDLKPFIYSLMHFRKCNYLDVDVSTIRSLIRTPDYESTVMTFIIVAIKMCLGLDDNYEIKLSNTVEKINEVRGYQKSYKIGKYSESSERLFSLREWCSYIQFRKIMLSKHNLRIAQSNGLDIDDHVYLEQMEARPKNTEELPDKISMEIISKIPEDHCTGVIPKSTFIPSVTPMSDYTEIIIDHCQEPEIKLKLAEDFRQYSLKYACEHLELIDENMDNIITGIREDSVIIENGVILGNIVTKKASTNMVYVKNCENRNWLKTNPPTIDHITYVEPESKINDRESDHGYDSEHTCKENEVESVLDKSQTAQSVIDDTIETASEKGDENCFNEKGDENCFNENADENCFNEKADENCLDEKADENCFNEKADEYCFNEKGVENCYNEKGNKNCFNEKVDENYFNEKGNGTCFNEKDDENCSNQKGVENSFNENGVQNCCSEKVHENRYSEKEHGNYFNEKRVENTFSEKRDEIGIKDEKYIIREENSEKNIFDDDFEDIVFKEECEKNNMLDEEDEANEDFNQMQNIDIPHEDFDRRSDISDEPLFPSFNPDTFDREKTIKELILFACKKYKIPVPSEYKITEPRKRKEKIFNNDTNALKRPRRCLQDGVVTTKDLLQNYYKNLESDFVTKVQQEINLAIRRTEVDGGNLESDNFGTEGNLQISVTERNSTFANQSEGLADLNDRSSSSIGAMDHQSVDLNASNKTTDVNDKKLVNDESTEKILFEDDEEMKLDDLMPKGDPEFDENKYEVDQLYIEVKPGVENLDSIMLDFKEDPDLKEIIEKKIEESKDSAKFADLRPKKKMVESDSEDEIPLSVFKEEKLRIEEKLRKEDNFERLIEKGDFPEYKYWIRHYDPDFMMRSNDFYTKFDEELKLNTPTSFSFVLQECSSILSCSNFYLYKKMQLLEQFIIARVKNQKTSVYNTENDLTEITDL